MVVLLIYSDIIMGEIFYWVISLYCQVKNRFVTIYDRRRKSFSFSETQPVSELLRYLLLLLRRSWLNILNKNHLATLKEQIWEVLVNILLNLQKMYNFQIEPNLRIL